MAGTKSEVARAKLYASKAREYLYPLLISKFGAPMSGLDQIFGGRHMPAAAQFVTTDTAFKRWRIVLNGGGLPKSIVMIAKGLSLDLVEVYFAITGEKPSGEVLGAMQRTSLKETSYKKRGMYIADVFPIWACTERVRVTFTPAASLPNGLQRLGEGDPVTKEADVYIGNNGRWVRASFGV